MLPTPHRLLGALLLALPAAAPAAEAPELRGLQPAVHHASLAKQQAILGGASKLQMIAAQQSGAALPAVRSFDPAGIDLPAFRPGEGASDRPDVFGSTALQVSATPLDRQWQRILSAPDGKAAAPAALVRQFKAEDRRAQIEAVNRWINRSIAFRDDIRTYGKSDRWATLSESLARGTGDCEDYAIAKMQLLRSLGFPAEDLYLTVVRDLVRRADHALLLVRLDDRLLVLDNNIDRILESQEVDDYRPIFSYAAGSSWVHGYRRDMQFADSAASAVVRGTR